MAAEISLTGRHSAFNHMPLWVKIDTKEIEKQLSAIPSRIKYAAAKAVNATADTIKVDIRKGVLSNYNISREGFDSIAKYRRASPKDKQIFATLKYKSKKPELVFFSQFKSYKKMTASQPIRKKGVKYGQDSNIAPKIRIKKKGPLEKGTRKGLFFGYANMPNRQLSLKKSSVSGRMLGVFERIGQDRYPIKLRYSKVDITAMIEEHGDYWKYQAKINEILPKNINRAIRDELFKAGLI